MHDVSSYVEKRISLVLWDVDDSGEPDVWIHAGTLERIGVDIVLTRGEGPSIPLRREWLDRLRAVPDDLRATMLDAEWFIKLTVEKLPPDADLSEYVPIAIPNHRTLDATANTIE